MTTPTTPTDAERLKAEQITDDDRRAAAELLGGAAPDGLLDGRCDSLSLVQAFAAHRLRAIASERAAVRVCDEWIAYMDEAVSKAPEPLRQLGEYLAGLLDEDQWKTAERYLNAAVLERTDHSDQAGEGEKL